MNPNPSARDGGLRVEDVAATSHFILTLANGRRIESTWDFGDRELARLIGVAESA